MERTTISFDEQLGAKIDLLEEAGVVDSRSEFARVAMHRFADDLRDVLLVCVDVRESEDVTAEEFAAFLDDLDGLPEDR